MRTRFLFFFNFVINYIISTHARIETHTIENKQKTLDTIQMKKKNRLNGWRRRKKTEKQFLLPMGKKKFFRDVNYLQWRDEKGSHLHYLL